MEPLEREEKLFLQRLLAHHVLTEDDAQALYEELFENDDDESNHTTTRETTMQDCFRTINARLTTDFGLEITTVSLNQKRYHAIINQNSDNIAKKSFLTLYKPNKRAYIRLVLEKLASSEHQEGASRMDLINLRTELSEPYTSLGLRETEHCLEELLDEQWLVLDDDEDDDNTKNRRTSMNAQIKLGPRAYLELSHLLTDFGLPKEDLPQFIFHRA